MSNNKQSSSIDFFWNQLPEILPFTLDTETAVKLWEAFEQAKAMHKEEITQAWKKGDGEFDNVAKQMSLEYYNETFNNNEQQ